MAKIHWFQLKLDSYNTVFLKLFCDSKVNHFRLWNETRALKTALWTPGACSGQGWKSVMKVTVTGSGQVIKISNMGAPR